MTAKGHMTLATTATLITVYTALPYFLMHFDTEKIIIIYFLIIFGSVLPDIDEENSYIGRRFMLISTITSTIFKHRTITHYLIFALAIAFTGFFLPDYKYIFYSIAIGVLLHDCGDMLTKGGITGFFFPFFPNTRIVLLPRFLRFYTNSINEYFLILGLVCLNIFLTITLLMRLL